MRGHLGLLAVLVLAGCATPPAAVPDEAPRTSVSTTRTGLWQLEGNGHLVYDGVTLADDAAGCQAFGLGVPYAADRLFVALSNQVPPNPTLVGVGFPRLRLVAPDGDVLVDDISGATGQPRYSGNITVRDAAPGPWQVEAVVERPVANRSIDVSFWLFLNGTEPAPAALDGPHSC